MANSKFLSRQLNIAWPKVVSLNYIKRSSILQLLFSFALYGSIMISSYHSFPLGLDTPVYYLHLRMLKEQGYVYLLNSGWDRPLTTVFLAIIDFLLSPFNLAPPDFLLYIQLILGMIYISSIFFIVYMTTKNQEIAFLSSALTATSANTLMLQPQISNLLGLSLAIFSLGFFMKYQIQPDRNSFFTFLFFMTISYLSYPYAMPFIICIIVLSLILNIVLTLIMNPSIETLKENIMRNFRLFGIVSILGIAFFLIWYYLWGGQILYLVRFWQVLGGEMKASFTLSFVENWISLETSILKITGLLGLFFIYKHVKTKAAVITFYAWLTTPILANVLFFFSDLSNRFFLLIPFAVPSAFLVYSVWNFIRSRKINIFSHRVKIKNELVASTLVVILLAGNYVEAFCWQSSRMGPYISKQDYQVLLNAKDLFRDNAVILIYPVNEKGNWAESLLASISRNVVIYYGKIGSLVIQDIPLSDPQLFMVKPPEKNYTIVLLEGFYPITPIIQEIFSKVDDYTFYKKIDNSLQTSALSKLENYRIAVVGSEADLAINIIGQLGFSCDYLGNAYASLPDLNKLKEYDLLVLLDWSIPSQDDFSKLVDFNIRKPIIALSVSGYCMYAYNESFFEEAFGAKRVNEFSSQYNNISFLDNGTSFTSHLVLPYTRQLSGSSPVTDLTTSKGLARITGTNNSYVLIVNEHNNKRNAYFGIQPEDMSLNEATLFRRLILWTLRLLE